MTTLITLEPLADPRRVASALEGLGLWTTHLETIDGAGRALALGPSSRTLPRATLAALPGVAEVLAAPSAHPLLDRLRGRPVEVRPGLSVGPGEAPLLLAGPCSAESASQVEEAAALAADAGARILRGGAFKPRTSPHAFQGHGRRALGWLRDAADAHDLALVTEVMSEREVEAVAEVADLLQVGSRSMQAFALLGAIGRAGRPVLLKRGRAATLAEWRLAAEHLLAAGASGVVFCERGLAGLDLETRNVLDLGAVALFAHGDRLPIVVDPSHGAGRRDLILPLSRAALAAGAHGLIVEAHPDAAVALSDGAQALGAEELAEVGALVATP